MRILSKRSGQEVGDADGHIQRKLFGERPPSCTS
jgi:hypothetical protein